MSQMGIKVDNFKVPVCNSFKAKILNDQLCYEVDIKNFTTKISKKDLKVGLTFLLDYNEDRQIKLRQDITNQEDIKVALVDSVADLEKDQKAFIYLDTIGKRNIVICYYRKTVVCNNLYFARARYVYWGRTL